MSHNARQSEQSSFLFMILASFNDRITRSWPKSVSIPTSTCHFGCFATCGDTVDSALTFVPNFVIWYLVAAISYFGKTKRLAGDGERPAPYILSF